MPDVGGWLFSLVLMVDTVSFLTSFVLPVLLETVSFGVFGCCCFDDDDEDGGGGGGGAGIVADGAAAGATFC